MTKEDKMPVAEWIFMIQTAAGLFTTLWSKARMEHGDAIPSKDELLKMAEQNQKEIDAGKIG